MMTSLPGKLDVIAAKANSIINCVIAAETEKQHQRVDYVIDDVICRTN